MLAWRLYVDESGRFDDDHDAVVVVGLLVPERVSPRQVMGPLRSAAVGLPWPPHAAHYNVPILHVLGRYLARETDPTRPWDSVERGAQRYLAAAAAAAGPLVNRVLESLRRGQRPELSDLTDLEVAARAASRGLDEGARLAAETLKDEFRERVRAVMAALAAEGLLLGVAAEATSNDAGASWVDVAVPRAAQGITPPTPTHRYFGLLGALFERVADVLDRAPGPHTVRPWVLTRGVHDMRGLREPDLERVVKAYQPNRRAVEFKPGQVVRFDDSVSGFSVLADFAANWSRKAVSGASLAEIEERVAALETPARSGAPGLSHIAASGPPGRYVRAARAMRRDLMKDLRPQLAPPQARWACEQAIEWAVAFAPEASS